MKLQAAYNKLIKTETILSDPAQQELIQLLDKLREHLEQKSSWLFAKKFENFGYYIFGDVGRGKSFLMQLFYDNCNCPKKRIHFHEFMSEIHRKLHHLRKTKPNLSDPLKTIAHAYAKEIKLLCFDEFQVTDVADAMILERLFRLLFKHKIFIVTTSNRHPSELYLGGLQREKYLEFVEFLTSKLAIFSLDGQQDYRHLKVANLAKKYLYPLNKKNQQKISEIFADLTGNSKTSEHPIKVLGREIIIKEAASSCAYIDFNEFCKKPYASNDFQAIANEFSTIFITNIPKLSSNERDYAKRFVNLIDIIYDKQLDVIFYADCLPEEIYQSGKGKFEFARTVSRITELSA